MSRAVIALRIVLPALAIATAAACGSTVEGTPRAADGTPSQAPPTTTSGKARPTTTAPSTGGSVDFQAEIGDCVNLGGTDQDATIEKAGCGSPRSNYRVIGKAPTSGQCVSDADSVYYEQRRGKETGALCLDRDWVVGGCMDIGGDDTKRVDCGGSAVEGVRVLSILQNTDSIVACNSDGFVYDQRRFVVCVQDM
ncbi:LppU family putative lipoprotein [Nocardia wallacei]|uniref:LppU family putative lipoprotein n=1 Tax=Nocardia wallacei TaxID=480035 RepID=UPI003CC80475